MKRALLLSLLMPCLMLTSARAEDSLVKQAWDMSNASSPYWLWMLLAGEVSETLAFASQNGAANQGLYLLATTGSGALTAAAAAKTIGGSRGEVRLNDIMPIGNLFHRGINGFMTYLFGKDTQQKAYYLANARRLAEYYKKLSPNMQKKLAAAKKERLINLAKRTGIVLFSWIAASLAPGRSDGSIQEKEEDVRARHAASLVLYVILTQFFIDQSKEMRGTEEYFIEKIKKEEKALLAREKMKQQAEAQVASNMNESVQDDDTDDIQFAIYEGDPDEDDTFIDMDNDDNNEK